LLLLHSTACDSRQWDPQRILATDRTVIMVDLRGFGQSPLPAEPYSDVLDVLDVLDRLGVSTAAVVGSSGGGHVALQLAANFPDRVGALVLLCSAAPGVPPTADLRVFAELEEELLEAGDVEAATELNVRTWLGPEADDETRESLRVMQRHAFRVQLAAGDSAEERSLDVELEKVVAPTTVVSGGRDLHHFAVVARHLVSRLPAAEHVELDWAGHLPNLERPVETTALISRSLAWS
jgi:pimeloyl-ACP methyl ester carboxylesterase